MAIIGQTGIETMFIGAFVLTIIGATVWSAVHRVPDGDVRILLVLGEERQILEPGLYFIPPFVSATYPIDARTMQYETPHGSRSIPSDLREDVPREPANDEPLDTASKPGVRSRD